MFLATSAHGQYTDYRMKKLSVAALLLGFCSLALLSMLVMSFSMSAHEGCFTSLSGGAAACSSGISFFLASHFSFFNQFVQAVFGSLLALSLLFVIAFITVRSGILDLPSRFFSRVRSGAYFSPRIFRERAWLALLETSPTFS